MTLPAGFRLMSGEMVNNAISQAVTVRMASVPLSHDQLIHLHSSPITVLPPPGAGLGYIIFSSVYQIVDSGTPFISSDSGPALYYGHADDNETYADGGALTAPFVSTQSQIFQPTTNMASD